MKPKVHQIGFTLIELMIVVAIIAIITAIVLPNYQNHICKTQRQKVKMDLLAYGQSLDQFYTTNNFSYLLSSGSVPSVYPNYSPADGDANGKHFDITLTIPNGDSFSLSSGRSSGSCGDGVMTLTNTGTKSWVINGTTQSDWNE